MIETFLKKKTLLTIGIILTIVSLTTYIVKNFSDIDSRVYAIEKRQDKMDTFLNEFKAQHEEENNQLIENGVMLKLMTDYFHLTPKDKK